MEIRASEIRSALGRSWSWSALLAGVFVALAAQLLLKLLGSAFAYSVGDGVPGAGFGLWSVLVDLGSLALGAAFAAYLQAPDRLESGVVIGLFTWVVATVLSRSLVAVTLLRTGNDAAAAWSSFFGVLLSMATAAIGGVWGTQLRRRRTARMPFEPTPMPPMPPSTPTSPLRS